MEKRLRKIGLFVGAYIAFAVALSSCNDPDPGYDYLGRLNTEVSAIDSYLAVNNIGRVVKDPVGIRMQITYLGNGLPAQILDSIDVDYTGRLFVDNSAFQTGRAQGQLAGFIDGWKAAFLTLPAGSVAKLYIPSPLAYQDNAQTGIPANSTLVFDVEFNGVKVTAAQKKQLGTDTVAIRNYLKGKGLNTSAVKKDDSGVFYKITQEGNGVIPEWYDKLTLTYTITLMNTNENKVVDNVTRQPDETFYSRLVDYLHGMKIGMMKMSEGGKATLYIPSGLAFGAEDTRDNNTGSVVVPANTNIIVDIELKDVLEN